MQEESERNWHLLSEYLRANAAPFHRHFKMLAAKYKISDGDTVENVASELLTTLWNEAHSTCAKFDATRDPRAWLYRITYTIVLRRRDAVFGHHKRVNRMLDAYADPYKAVSETDIYDRLVSAGYHPSGQTTGSDPFDIVSERLNTSQIWDSVSVEERNLLTDYYELGTKEAAAKHQIAPGTLRVRIHRLVDRLRTLHASNADVVQF